MAIYFNIRATSKNRETSEEFVNYAGDLVEMQRRGGRPRHRGAKAELFEDGSFSLSMSVPTRRNLKECLSVLKQEAFKTRMGKSDLDAEIVVTHKKTGKAFLAYTI